MKFYTGTTIWSFILAQPYEVLYWPISGFWYKTGSIVLWSATLYWKNSAIEMKPTLFHYTGARRILVAELGFYWNHCHPYPIPTVCVLDLISRLLWILYDYTIMIEWCPTISFHSGKARVIADNPPSLFQSDKKKNLVSKKKSEFRKKNASMTLDSFLAGL